MTGNNQIEGWNQQNKNKDNTKNQGNKVLVLWENQQDRQTLTETGQMAEKEYPN